MSININFNIFNKGTVVNGVEVHLQGDGTYVFNLVKLKRKRSAFNISQSVNDITDIKQLRNHIQANEPIILVLIGKGVINKKIHCNENEPIKSLLNKVLPNANENEFSIQRIRIDTENSFVSVVRNSILDELIVNFQSQGLRMIMNCFLGPFVLNYSWEYLNFAKVAYVLNYKITSKESVIVDVEILPDFILKDTFSVGEEFIDGRSVLPFSAAVSYFVNADVGVLNNFRLSEIISESIERKKFEFRGWLVLLLSLTILVANFLVFNNYWSKNEDLVSQLAVNSSSLKTVDTLKKEVLQKKEFLEQNGLLENSMTSYYADCLASNLPRSITWINLDIHPLKKKESSNSSDVLEFETNTIKIAGNCNKSIDLNDWMKEIKQLEWIKDVELLSYKQDNALEAGFFLLEITLK
ncbi:MAG: hypothetical protein J0L87_05985 [Bacteroidetes bacterium]|nr:hypothetical protein [Bacteroidota bacterium]